MNVNQYLLVDCVLTFVAGVLTGVPFLFGDQLPSIVSLSSLVVGLAIAVDRAVERGAASALAFSICFTLGLGGTTGIWVPEALRNLGSSPAESWLGFVGAVVWSTGPPSVVVFAVFSRLRIPLDWRGVVVLPATLFVGEHVWLRIPGSVPWSLWGHGAIELSGLSQLAVLGGVPLVSASLALGGCALATVVGPRVGCENGRVAIATGVGLAAVCGLGLPAARVLAPAGGVSEETRSFVAIQPAVPRAERLRADLQHSILTRIARFSRAQMGSGFGQPRTIVWPENAAVVRPGEENPLEEAQEFARTTGSELIAGFSEATSNGTLVTSILAISPDGTIVDRADKAAAVPVVEAEHVSAASTVIGSAIGPAGAWEKVRIVQRVRPIRGESRASVALCFEVLFPRIVDQRRNDIATVVLNLADDSWVSSEWATRQLTNIARYRAIEQRLPLLRVAHGGLTASFDAYGRPLGSIELNRFGSLVLEAQESSAPPFSRRLAILTLPIGTGLSVWWVYPGLARWLGGLRRPSGDAGGT